MGNNIKIDYSDLETLSLFFKDANKHLDNAYRELGKSTDFGSSILQEFWRFGNKDTIFNSLRTSRKMIESEIQQNKELISLISSIESTYENAVKTEKKKFSVLETIDQLSPLSVIAISSVMTVVFPVFGGIFSTYTVVSKISSSKKKSATTTKVNAKKGISRKF